jgi:hypothetical protein
MRRAEDVLGFGDANLIGIRHARLTFYHDFQSS